MGNDVVCLCFGDDKEIPKGVKQVFNNRHNYPLLKWTKIEDIGCSNLQTPPSLKNENEIIFLSTTNNSTTYTIYNLTESKFTSKSEEIKCPDTFDISNTVYAYNQNNNKIYFIENNKNILSLNISTAKPEITSLNKSITTTNDNYATIHYNNNNIYIMGDESKSYESNDEYITIPYSSITKQKTIHEKIELIRKFGWYSRVINVSHDGKNCIFIMGGKKDLRKPGTNKPNIHFNGSLWELQLFNSSKHAWNLITREDGRKEPMMYYTQQPQHSFGVINYKNKYIIIFGGHEHQKGKLRKVGFIWILCLCDKDKYKMRKGFWHELYHKLPLPGYYHAIYIDNKDHEEIIHLFSYDGTYYTIEMNDILNGLKQRQYIELHTWMQAGKTVLPTKSKSIENVGPKGDTEVDKMLDELGKTYEPYKNKLKGVFLIYDDILDNDMRSKLEELIPKADHRAAVIQKAQTKK